MDRCHKDSHGIGALFEENWKAAVDILYGSGEQMRRSGHVSRTYAEGFCGKRFASVEEWAGWIIAENKKIVGPVHKMECEYQRIMEERRPDDITDADVEAFRLFCERL